MFERLTNNARVWRVGSTIFAVVCMTALSYYASHETFWLSAGDGMVMGVIQFFMAPYYRRLAQERLAARRGIPPAA